jgi:hypothetical protein
MANKYKNEMTIKIGEVEILLRPTFDNCASLETAIGKGIPQLAFDMMKGQSPSMTDLARIVFHSQADKKLTQQQVWDLMLYEGLASSTPIIKFIAQITAGDKNQAELSDEDVKKNTTIEV